MRRKQFRSANRDTLNKRNRESYHRCKDHVLAQMKIYHSLLNVRMARNLRRRLHHALKGEYKAGSAVRDLGCSIDQLKRHLEEQFSLGMNWDNWGVGSGKWNIDHIKPLSSFNLSDNGCVVRACNYKNLRPLWSEDNAGRYSRESYGNP